MLVAWSTTSQIGLCPTLTVGGFWPQPVPVLPLHVAPLITETVSPLPFDPPFAAYTVFVATSTSTAEGPRGSLIVLTGFPQPAVVTALHRAASITNTCPAGLATYTVRVLGLNAAATGNPPVLMVASGLAQPLVTCALHRAPSTTVTVPAPSAT